MEVRVYQVGFTPIYTPFYVTLGKLKEEGILSGVEYVVGKSDRDNLFAACQYKFENKENFVVVLTALHNVNQIESENHTICRSGKCSKHKNPCKGMDDEISWYFPWIFIVKLPTFVLFKGDKGFLERFLNKGDHRSLDTHLNWIRLMDKVKSSFKNNNEKLKLYIYPKGATINDVVLNHIFDEETKQSLDIREELDFDKEDQLEASAIENNSFIVTLNPMAYMKEESIYFILKPTHNFFAFTGIGIPIIEEKGITSRDTSFVYKLEEAYIEIIKQAQEYTSPFFSKRDEERSEFKEQLKTLLKKGLNINSNSLEISYKHIEIENVEGTTYVESETTKYIDIEHYISEFEKLYEQGIYREQQTDVIEDYLKDNPVYIRTSSVFNRDLYLERVRDAVAAVLSRNLSHVYGSNVLHYMKNKKIRFLADRMDYIAFTIGEDSAFGIYSFFPVTFKEVFGNTEKMFTDTPIKYLWETQDFKKFHLEIEYKGVDENDLLALPPAVGFQAWLSIFENILRNSAKYMRPGKIKLSVKSDVDNSLCESIEINGPNKNELENFLNQAEKKCGKLYSVEILDESIKNDPLNPRNILTKVIKTMQKKYPCISFKIRVEKDGDKFYKVSIIDLQEFPRSEEPEQVAKKLNDFFETSLVNFKGKIVRKYWGFKEIKISAAVLRGILKNEIDFIPHLRPKEPPLVRVGIEEINNRKHLLYEIRLLQHNLIGKSPEKPSEFLIVSSQSSAESSRKFTRIFGTDEAEEDFDKLKEVWLKKLSGGKSVRLIAIWDDKEAQDFMFNYSNEPEKHERSFNMVNAEQNHENTLNILYLRHGRDELLSNAKYFYYQSFSGGEIVSSYVKNALKGSEFYKYKLTESALLKILIIDERAQAQEKDNIDKLRKMNIYIDEEFSYVDIVKNGELFKKFSQKLEEINKTFNPHFVVVHLSLLEQADRNELDFYDKLIEKFKNSDILITTGRGAILGKYRQKYGYKIAVPVSTVLDALARKDKIALSDVLISINRSLAMEV